MNPFSIADKNILITGATSGLGSHCASVFDKMGANLILIGRNENKMLNIISKLDDRNKNYFIFDLEDFHSYEDLINEVVKSSGPISGFVHSAGVDAMMPLRVLNQEIHEKTYRVNTISFYELVRVLSKKKFCGENCLGKKFFPENCQKK